jgi:hypothetical protein
MSSIQTAHKRIIRTLCLVAVVIFGIMTTLGSGGGGDSATPPPQITADCVWTPSGGTDTTWNNCNWQ